MIVAKFRVYSIIVGEYECVQLERVGPGHEDSPEPRGTLDLCLNLSDSDRGKFKSGKDYLITIEAAE